MGPHMPDFGSLSEVQRRIMFDSVEYIIYSTESNSEK